MVGCAVIKRGFDNYVDVGIYVEGRKKRRDEDEGSRTEIDSLVATRRDEKSNWQLKPDTSYRIVFFAGYFPSRHSLSHHEVPRVELPNAQCHI